MDEGKHFKPFLKCFRSLAVTAAMAGSLLLAVTAPVFADTAKSQATGTTLDAAATAKGQGASSGDANNTLNQHTQATTQGGNGTSSATPTATNSTTLGNVNVTSTPAAASNNTNTVAIQQTPRASGGTNTNSGGGLEGGTTSLSCTMTNNPVTNTQTAGTGSNGVTAKPNATCNQTTGNSNVTQSANGTARGHSIDLNNDLSSTGHTDPSTADAKVSAKGKAKIADSGAGATTATTSGTKANDTDGSEGTDHSTSSGDANNTVTKDTHSDTRGGNADASSDPLATNTTTVGNTSVQSSPQAVSFNLNGVNITCTPTATGGTNTNTLSSSLTGTASNGTVSNTQDSTVGPGSGNNDATLEPKANITQHVGSHHVNQFANATASCGTINIFNTLTSNATTGDSTAKAHVSATGKAVIKDSGAAATSATTSWTGGEGSHGGGAGRSGDEHSGTAIITSGGSTNIVTDHGGDLAAVNVSDLHDEGVQIITSGGSTNITRTLRMGVQAVTVPPPPPSAGGGVQAIVPELAPTGGSRGLWVGETGGQPALPFVLGLIVCGYGIAWVGRRLISRT